MARTPILSIGQRFGLVYGVLLGLLAWISVLVVLYVGDMRRDSAKLLEETREATLAAELVGELRILRVLASLEAPPVEALATHRDAAIRCITAMFETPDEDPSDADHQRAENRLGESMRADLARLDAWTRAPGAEAPIEALERALRYARVMAGETAEESERSNLELLSLADRAVWTIWATVIVTAVFLWATWWFVRRRVVGPLRSLREGAEKFGKGMWGVRVGLRQRDEIGDLAHSFNAMADRLQGANAALEQRVEERTRQFVRAARLADLGSLAAGVAHEINNPLASIASCAEGLERRLAKGALPADEQLDYLRTIAAEAWRARHMTQQLLALGRYDAGPLASIDLAGVCQRIARMTTDQFAAVGVELVVTAPEPGVEAVLREGEVTQLLLNLLLNARDASPQNRPGGAVVWLRCAKRGDAVVFEVEDEGEGIAEDLMLQVFEPFFTTKPAGQGTGLGLALVAAIVEGYGGDIDVRRGDRGGALFSVTLPSSSPARP